MPLAIIDFSLTYRRCKNMQMIKKKTATTCMFKYALQRFKSLLATGEWADKLVTVHMW